MNVRQMLTLAVCLLLAAIGTVATWWAFQHPTGAVTLRLATGPENGAFLSIGQGIADVLPSGELRIQPRSTDGSVANMELLADRQVDLAIVQNDTEPIGDVCTLIPLHRGVCHFLVPAGDERINDIHDLRGMTVAVGSRDSGNWHVVHQLLEHFGITEGDFEPRYLGIAESGAKLATGDIDAALFITAITSQSLQELMSHVDVRYISLGSPEPGNEVDGFAVTYPYVERFTIPRFVYPVRDDRQGLPRKPTESFALRSSLVCRADLPDAVARQIVESIVTNRATIMRAHHEAYDINEHFDASELQFPLHHGAAAYYQRLRPGFLERYSESMAFILSLFLALCGMAAAFNKWLTLRKKNRIDRYYERLDAILDELNIEHPSRERLDSIEAELLAMRHDAVRELVNERLLADDSFQIFQSLLTDCYQQLATERGSAEA